MTDQVSVTYDLNRLQQLRLPGPALSYLETHNSRFKRPMLLGVSNLSIPYFRRSRWRSQSRFEEINGRDRISFCGAYWGYGFHEDGVNSALAVTSPFGLGLESVTGAAGGRRDRSQQEMGV